MVIALYILFNNLLQYLNVLIFLRGQYILGLSKNAWKKSNLFFLTSTPNAPVTTPIPYFHAKFGEI